MKAVIMAGGFGLRLHPLTITCPKPMVTFINKPVLAHLLDWLKQHQISEVIITVQFLAEQIQKYFGDGHQFDMSITYAVESCRLGTAGSVKNAQPYLDQETLLVVSGDIITDVDLQPVIQFHHERQACLTVVTHPVCHPGQYGLVITDADGRVQQYIEKPVGWQPDCPLANTGIYLLEPEILADMQPQRLYDFAYDIFPQLLAQENPFFGYQAAGYWCDVGCIPRYFQATAEALAGHIKNIMLGPQLQENIWGGQDVDIAPDVVLQGPIYLGHNVKIQSGVIIHGPTIVGDNTIIDSYARVEQSIIGQNCFVGTATQLRQSVIPSYVI